MPHLTPNYLTVDPVTGAVGADFAGHIKAAGIDLNAAEVATPPTDRRIAWNRETDGALIAQVYGWEDGTNQMGQLSAGPPGWTFGGQFGQIRVGKSLIDNLAKVEAEGVNQPAGRSGYVLVIDELQKSSFLQAVDSVGSPTLSRHIGVSSDFGGDATLTWPGASTVSNTITVTHNLTFTPLIVLPIIVNAPNPFPTIACFNYTPTQFQARGNFDTFAPTVARTDGFRWLAIG